MAPPVSEADRENDNYTHEPSELPRVARGAPRAYAPIPRDPPRESFDWFPGAAWLIILYNVCAGGLSIAEMINTGYQPHSQFFMSITFCGSIAVLAAIRAILKAFHNDVT